MYDKTMLRSQMHEHIPQQRGQSSLIDAEHLNGGSCWIGQRTQEIQHSPDTHLLSWSGTMFHGSMIERGKEKADPDFIDAIGHMLGREIDLDPKRREDVRAP